MKSLTFAVAVGLCLIACRVSQAVTFSPGDIIVTEFFEGWYKIDPVTHQQTHLPFLDVDSLHLAVDDTTGIYYLDGDEVFRVDWATNATAPTSVTGIQFADGLTVEPGGGLLIADCNSVDKYLPLQGTTSEFAAGGDFFDPQGIATGADGRVFFTEFYEGLFELNPATGVKRHVPTPLLGNPGLVAVQPGGDVIVMVLSNGGELLRVNPDTGATSLFSGDLPASPRAMAVEADGDILLTAPDGVYRFDGVTGVGTSIASGTFFSPSGIAVIPVPATPEPGDYNGDGNADADDYAAWRSQYGLTGDQPADGNADGVVNAADYTIWRDAFSAAPSAADAAPEPTSMILLLFAASFAMKSRR